MTFQWPNLTFKTERWESEGSVYFPTIAIYTRSHTTGHKHLYRRSIPPTPSSSRSQEKILENMGREAKSAHMLDKQVQVYKWDM